MRSYEYEARIAQLEAELSDARQLLLRFIEKTRAPKGIIVFNLPEERQAFDFAMRMIGAGCDDRALYRAPAGILVYPLPEDHDEFYAAATVIERVLGWSDLAEYLRRRTKYETLDGAVYEALWAVREKMVEIENERGLREPW